MSEPHCKKRVSERQLIKGEEEEDDENPDAGLSLGGFARASTEVLATRRIVKARRTAGGDGGGGSKPVGASQSPFAFVALSQPPLEVKPAGAEKPAEANVLEAPEEESEEVSSAPSQGITEGIGKDVVEDAKPPVSEAGAEGNDGKGGREGNAGDNAAVETSLADMPAEVQDNDISGQTLETSRDENGAEKAASEAAEGVGTGGAKPSSFAQLSSGANAFSASFGSGFGSSSFSFSSAANSGPAVGGFSFGALNPGSAPSFSFGASSSNLPSLSSVFGNGSESPFQLFASGSAPSASTAATSHTPSAVTPLQETTVETGEEDEQAAFACDASLYEFVEGGKWKERGKGELRVNVPVEQGRPARLVMRARGNFRLLLNANLFSDMKLQRMDGRGVSFACANSIGADPPAVATFAVRVKEEISATSFEASVEENKSRAVTEGSPEVV